MYLVTSATIYIPNGAIESKHPSAFEIEKKIYPIDLEGFLWENAGNCSPTGYYTLSQDPLIRFKYLSRWENGCDRNGDSIRWHLPKGAKAIY
jgi:hypothetical protein